MWEIFFCLPLCNEHLIWPIQTSFRYAPIGILFLIAGKIIEMKDLAQIGGQLGMYTVCVIVGLLVHGLFILPLLFFLITWRNPYTFIGGLIQALVTALGTSSRWLEHSLHYSQHRSLTIELLS